MNDQEKPHVAEQPKSPSEGQESPQSDEAGLDRDKVRKGIEEADKEIQFLDERNEIS